MMSADADRCNMPHVNKGTYPKAAEGYKLEYVEVVIAPFFELLSYSCQKLPVGLLSRYEDLPYGINYYIHSLYRGSTSHHQALIMNVKH